MLRRIASALVLGVLVLLVIWFRGPLLDAVLALVLLLACFEFSKLNPGTDFRQLLSFLVPICLLFLGATLVSLLHPGTAIRLLPYMLAGLAAIVLPLTLVGGKDAWTLWTLVVSGTIYIASGTSAILLLLLQTRGPASGGHYGQLLFIVILAGVIACDTAAYFVGSWIGKHRFFPAISPAKSVEGAVAGFCFAVVLGLVLGVWLLHMFWPLAAILGGLVGAGAQAGDLAESSMKRIAGVKDSGSLIPGHGGILDRIDSLMVVAPLSACYLGLLGMIHQL